MKNTLQLKKQLRARRKKQSKRQTLSLEQLEPKQLLVSINGSWSIRAYTGDLNAPDLNIYFSDYNRSGGNLYSICTLPERISVARYKGEWPTV